jgi:hypothetical protein
MKIRIWLIVCCCIYAVEVWAEIPAVTVHVPETKAWIGQRVQIFVELRASGSFAGNAGFDLPQLPGVLLMKIGNPVVGSEEIGDQSWFVQTHEFALFSQKPGVLEVPAFAVRFSHRQDFAGPVTEVQAEAPGWNLEIERPPGTERIGFLIVTESLEVTETWEPRPGPVRAGAMFKRTIVQQAPQIPGMALAPMPAAAPEGVRIYTGESTTEDRFERGDFLGRRRDTFTYLFTEPGTVTLPALSSMWWNPRSKTLQSTTLPAVVVQVAPALAAPPSTARPVWPYLSAGALAIGLIAWKRRRLAAWLEQYCLWLNPPERAVERNLLRACGCDDAKSAAAAWFAWRNRQPIDFRPGPELDSAVLHLHRNLFGPEPGDSWRGNALACAFRKNLATGKKHRFQKKHSALPLLNA